MVSMRFSCEAKFEALHDTCEGLKQVTRDGLGRHLENKWLPGV